MPFERCTGFYSHHEETNMNIILAEISKLYSANEIFEKIGINFIPEVNIAKNKTNRVKAVTPDSLTEVHSPAITVSENRNNKLTSLAGTLRNKGLDAETILAALKAVNENQFENPLPENEVYQIAQGIMRYSFEDVEATIASLNDTGNAIRFSERNKTSLRYVPELKDWMFWNNDRWEVDCNSIHVMAAAKTTATNLFVLAAQQPNVDMMKLVSKYAKASLDLQRLNAMIKLATFDPLLSLQNEKLDANSMLLGVGNGVIDLVAGALIPNDQFFYITRYSNVEFDVNAQCPTFISFLNKIFKGDVEIIAFIRRVFGYCLTGSTKEQVYFFFFGNGANGKTTLLRVLEKLLGSDFVKQTPAETLMASLQGKQTNDLARLHRVRAVIANEVEDDSCLAESLIKQISGGDKIVARFLHKEFFEFIPEFKLIIAGNHKPIIKGTDSGIWRRTVPVDFPVSIPKAEQDPDLSKKLEAELPGILNWAIKGCLQWQQTGLNIPQLITNNVTEYRSEMDWMGQWIEDCCDLGVTETAKASQLYSSYKVWAESNGYRVLNSTVFGRRLTERGFSKSRSSNGNMYLGISDCSSDEKLIRPR